MLERVEAIRSERIRAVLDHPIVRIGHLVIAGSEIPYALRERIVDRVFSKGICRGCDRARGDDGEFRHRPGCRTTDKALLRLCQHLGVPATIVVDR